MLHLLQNAMVLLAIISYIISFLQEIKLFARRGRIKLFSMKYGFMNVTFNYIGITSSDIYNTI